MNDQNRDPARDTFPQGSESASSSWEYARAPKQQEARAVIQGADGPSAERPPLYPEYGPLGEAPVQGKRKKKHEKRPWNGLRVLAIVMSILFVLSTTGLIGYIVYDMSAEEELQQSQGNGNTPGISLGDIPRGEDVLSEDGKMSNNAIYKAVEPAVVGVVCYARSTTGTRVAGQGSGIIFDENGYIVTNNHVVTSDSGEKFTKIEIILSSGETYEAAVLGGDSETDLAVLKISATGLKTATFGNSDQVEVGDKALVIGNPSGISFAGSLTTGTISAVKRQVKMSDLSNKTTEFIQTDAAINPGNSGGALVNEYGQVIGITSAKLVAEDYEGMGFAIPINNAKPIIESLIQNGYVTGRVKIGITYSPISEALAQLNGMPKGLRVISIQEDSDALKKGLEVGDIITKIDDIEVYDADTVSSALEGKKPGDSIQLTVYRVDEKDQGLTLRITIQLSEKTVND